MIIKKKNILIFFNFFIYFKLIFFLVFSDHFDMLSQKLFLKNKKKYYFDVFSSEKYFEKQPQLYFQTFHFLCREIFLKSQIFEGSQYFLKK